MPDELHIIHYGRYRGLSVAVGQGSILAANVECIAVSGNSQGRMGGGVSGAVRTMVGDEIEQACIGLAPLRLGMAALLPPFKLAERSIKNVAYAAIMSKPIDSTNEDVISRAVLSVLVEANRRKLRSVAIPLMGGGVGRMPGMVAATAIVNAIRTFMKDEAADRHVKEVVLCGFYVREAQAMIRALDSLFGLALSKSAFAIVDLIDTFIGDDLLISEVQADRVCTGINRVIEVAVRVGTPVIYVKDIHQAMDRELVYAEHHGLIPEEAIKFHEKLMLATDPPGFTINKNTYSAFFGTGLDVLLRELEVETLILAGTQTHVCVKHTAAHAMMFGFRPIVLGDCTVASTTERHQWGLTEISRYLGEVSNSEYVAEILGNHATNT